MDDKQCFGVYIRRKRQEAGMTQKALGDALFVAESTVSKWERGLSYPDVSLIPEVCRVLGISEHEFFTACDDDKAHAQARAARSWRRLGAAWRWGFGGSYLLAAFICLLCDLCGGGGLSWSFVVLASLLLAACLTNLPLHLKRYRVTLTMAAATGALFLLLGACALYTGTRGVGMALAITALCLALPWGWWALWRFYGCHLPVVCSGWITVWSFALLAEVCALTGGDWLLTLAFPIAAVGWAVYWIYFAVGRWLPVNWWIKSGLFAGFTAALMPLGTRFAQWLGAEVTPTPEVYFDFGLLLERTDSVWINTLVFVCLLVICAVLLLIGIVRAAGKKRID